MIAPTQECNWNCEAEEFEGHPEEIPLGGPSRKEAEHPEPRFGQVRGASNRIFEKKEIRTGQVSCVAA